MTISTFLTGYTPAGCTPVTTDTDEDVAHYRRLLASILPLDAGDTGALQDDVYDLVQLDVPEPAQRRDARAFELVAIFECQAVEGLHSAYQFYLVLQHYGDGRQDDVQLVAVVDDQVLDLSQPTDGTSSLYYRNTTEHLRRIIAEQLYPQVVTALVLRAQQPA